MSGVGRGLILPESPPLPPSSFAKPSTPSTPTRSVPNRRSSITPVNSPNGIKSVGRRLRETSSNTTNHQHQQQHQTSASVSSEASATTSTLDVALLPLVPLPQHLSPYLSSTSPLTSTEKRTLFTSCYLRAASANNVDTLEWLLSIPSNPNLSHAENAANHRRRFSATGSIALESSLFTSSETNAETEEGEGIDAGLPDEAPRKWVDLEATDEQGYTALILSTALGHSDSVRTLIEGGVRVSAGDRTGWTPLHWAVQNNDLAIAAYLLNHHADARLTSLKGLTPRDLCKTGEDGEAMRSVLDSADLMLNERERGDELSDLDEDQFEGTEGDEASGEGVRRSESRASLASVSTRAAALEEERLEEKRQAVEKQRKAELAAEAAMYLELDVGVLAPKKPRPVDRGLKIHVSEEDESDEEEESPSAFDWQRCLPDQMLVFALDELPILFDVVITHYKPTRRRSHRLIPANVLFLCARFAQHFGTNEMLEELLVGAMERIESAVHDRPDDMAVSSFWLSNCLLLLYYLRKEPKLSATTKELRLHLSDLINEVFVFILRDAEKRIDKVLEQAMLEHEGLPGLEDVDFEDEWRFVKKLTGKRAKKATMTKSPSARSIFSTTSDAGTSPPRNLKSSTTSKPTAMSVEDAMPATITSILSSTLFVLQIYEIPPSIIVQAFSQLYYWIACEIFNRLLTQKKYLCRSRAMQVRLNASSLEEWARSNGLPLRMGSIHLAPLNQLLQWLQCLSSETAVDGLIGTIQSLRALNPSQLLKAAKDYRYEVDETKMEAECFEYLKQIEKQWERVKVQRTTEEVVAAGSLSPDIRIMGDEGKGLLNGDDSAYSSPEDERRSFAPEPMSSSTMNSNSPAIEATSPVMTSVDAPSGVITAEDMALNRVIRMIDEVFSDPSSFGSYVPPGGGEALGELLNSKHMLPFGVPSSADLLLNFDDRDAFGPFATPPPASTANSVRDGSVKSPSNASIRSGHLVASALAVNLESKASPMSSVKPPFVPVVPEEFFEMLDAAKRRAYVGSNAHTGEGGQWSNWRANMPLSDEDDDEEDDDDTEEEKMDEKDVGGGGDSSFEYDATPRPDTNSSRF